MAEAHDTSAERAVLGCVLMDNATLALVASKLAPPDFHAPAHRKILDAMLHLRDKGQPVDHLTLADCLRSRLHLDAVGGPAYLMHLDQEVPVVTNVLAYCARVKDQAVRRRLQEFGRRLAEVAGDPLQDPAQLVTKSSAHLATLIGGGTFKTLRQLNEERILPHLHRTQDTDEPPLQSTGIRALDNMIGGRQKTLIVVGARTGIGKSAFASSLIQHGASCGVRQGVFSLEDEGEWLGWRYLARQSGLAGFVLEFRKKTDDEWAATGEGWGQFAAYDQNILVDDRPGLNSMELAQAADDMILNHGVREIWIDHLGEMDHSVHRQESHALNIACSLRDIRGIQKRHGVPVWLLCQLLEDKNAKPEDVPTLGDFQGAREIVKKSRVALVLSRKGETMRIDALKQTKGLARRWCETRFLNAAMIAEIEGAADEEDQYRPAPPQQLPLRVVRGGYSRDPEEGKDE